MPPSSVRRRWLQMNKKEALRKVQELHFAMIELALFLNTHPCDEEALALYGKVQMMHAGA
ncbi:MAG: spore coat protein CotJB, partial [Firmicutes bacterium]|nr:spore coat protein CotJB [Bacillota bacterium]